MSNSLTSLRLSLQEQTLNQRWYSACCIPGVGVFILCDESPVGSTFTRAPGTQLSPPASSLMGLFANTVSQCCHLFLAIPLLLPSRGSYTKIIYHLSQLCYRSILLQWQYKCLQLINTHGFPSFMLHEKNNTKLTQFQIPESLIMFNCNV